MDETESSSRRVWRLSAILIILSVAIFSATQWPLYPYFLDSYYHLGVIQGFQQTNGLVLHDFWEAAPEGRVHLYPPLFHLLWVPLARMGVPLLFMAKLWSWMGLPLLLLLAWIVFSEIATPRMACLSVLALATPYSFFLSAVNYAPANLVLAGALGLILAVLKKRWLAGGLLLGLTFLLHAGLPWLLAAGLILYALIEPSFRKTVAATLSVGILAASPWLIHLGLHLHLLQFHPRGEERMLETPILLVGLGLAGLWIAWRKKGAGERLLAAMAIGFLPMLAGYRFRFFSAQGLFPFLILAAVAMDWLAQKIKRPVVILSALSLILFFSPTIHWSAQGVRFVWADTTLSTLAGRPQVVPRATAQPLFHKRLMGELAELVKRNSSPEDLIYCNLDYVGGILNVTTGRAITNEMLREMTQRPVESQVAPAKLIVWVKDPSGESRAELEKLVQQYGLRSAGETELAWVYVNPGGTGRRQIRKALLPWWVPLSGIALSLWLLVRDLRRRCR